MNNIRVFDKVSNRILIYEDSVEDLYERWNEQFKSRIEIIKCTGLKIKDKLLYEGDIFRFTSHDKYVLNNFDSIVRWFPEHACFGYEIIIEAYMRKEYYFSEHDELENDLLIHCEIIDNIYENKLNLIKT